MPVHDCLSEIESCTAPNLFLWCRIVTCVMGLINTWSLYLLRFTSDTHSFSNNAHPVDRPQTMDNSVGSSRRPLLVTISYSYSSTLFCLTLNSMTYSRTDIRSTLMRKKPVALKNRSVDEKWLGDFLAVYLVNLLTSRWSQSLNSFSCIPIPVEINRPYVIVVSITGLLVPSEWQQNTDKLCSLAQIF